MIVVVATHDPDTRDACERVIDLADYAPEDKRPPSSDVAAGAASGDAAGTAAAASGDGSAASVAAKIDMAAAETPEREGTR